MTKETRKLVSCIVLLSGVFLVMGILHGWKMVLLCLGLMWVAILLSWWVL